MMVAVARKRLDLRLPEELIAAVDEARGDVTRTRWIERALEAALSEAKEPPRGEQAGSGSVPSSEGVRPAASPRAPVSRLKDSYVKPFNPIPKGGRG